MVSLTCGIGELQRVDYLAPSEDIRSKDVIVFSY